MSDESMKFSPKASVRAARQDRLQQNLVVGPSAQNPMMPQSIATIPLSTDPR